MPGEERSTPTGGLRRARARAALLAILASGCVVGLPVPDLGGLYNRSAQEDLSRNPIVVVPGLLGSRLENQETGRTVWGAFVPLRRQGAELALPMRAGAPLAALRDSTHAVEVLDRVRVDWLRLSVEQKAYFHLLAALGAGGYRDANLGLAGAIDYGSDHFTCFQFPYDWRRDLVESARSLDAFLREKRAYVVDELRARGIERPDVKFDVVAHSLGGLVLRYYLRYGTAEPPPPGTPPSWAGAELIERAVLVGTPNGGSLAAFRALLEGERITWILPRYEAAVLGSFPSFYQLLPRSRHARVVAEGADAPLDILDPTVWQERRWGLLDPGQAAALAELLPGRSPTERQAIARDQVEKGLARAARVQGALDVPAATPSGLSIHLIAGDAAPTPARVAVDVERRVRVVDTGPGDGVVLRESALLDERPGGQWSPRLVTPIDWSRITFLFSDHLGMTRDPAFTDNLLFVLLEEPGRGRGKASAPAREPPGDPALRYDAIP